jgi:dipeptidyl aminopeptidase/acylaminoacyl peptidase
MYPTNPRGTPILTLSLLLACTLWMSGQSVGTQFSPAADSEIASPQAQQQQQQQEGGRGGARGRGGRGGRGGGGAVRGVYKSRIEPHWFANNSKFWYTNALAGTNWEFILVDAEKGKRGPAFDHQKLAAALTKAADQNVQASRLPLAALEFTEDGGAIKFQSAGKTWKCDLNSYECTVVASDGASILPSTSAQDEMQLANEDAGELLDAEAEGMGFADEQYAAPQQQETTQAQAQARGRGQGRGGARGQGRGGGGRGFTQGPRTSPDGKWTASIKEFNVMLRSEPDGQETQLTHDGVTNNAYGRLEWSPDSKSLVGWRIEPGDYNPVYLVQSSPAGGGLAVMTERHYEQPGNKLTSYELSVFDIASKKQSKPEVERVDFGAPNLRWRSDNQRFTYEKIDRGHQRLRVIEIDVRSAGVRHVVDEKTETFIWTAHPESYVNRGLQPITYLERTDEIIHASEKDGWRHLYLIDAKTGRESRITKGEWVVRGVDRIDEEQRQVWFQASGLFPDQDPYFIHYCRVNFDGSGMVALTRGNGTHTIQYSPDRQFILDTYSRVDLAPVNELRRVSDGQLVCQLEESDITELKATGWQPPEVFVAKGRDGKTDIWGIICRPRDYDPNRKYPILEDIYAGPHDSFAPKNFSGAARYEAYNRLGFIVVKLDGMGTANRSKAFHDVCWKNIKDGGFPDRILWIKAAAEKYPHMDISRVGIYGTSAGGQNAAAAVLFQPEFYKVAVANCGCHDNRIDKRSWNEQWMGYMPKDKIYSNDPDNWFSASSNIDNAAKLQGKLFLIVGEMDVNVPPESTMRFVDALIKAGKDFDLLVVPGGGHGAGSPVTTRRTQDFFVKHLLGQDPPNRNGSGG